jgi:hypothetical protein
MSTDNDIVYTTSDSLHMSSVQPRTLLHTLLNDIVQVYGGKMNEFTHQCPQSWQFVEHIKRMGSSCSTNDLIEMSIHVPSADEWRKLGKLLQYTPDSQDTRQHTWRWYRIQGLFKKYAYHADRQATCLAALSKIDTSASYPKRR